MNASNDNRAVSALFRVFGGAGETKISADARECSESRGMHLGEYRALSVLMPLTLLVAIAGPLTSRLGTGTGWLLAFPATFLALNVLPFAMACKSQAWQWWISSVACFLWAVWQRHASGAAGLLACVWIGIGIMNFIASFVLAWQATMRWSGLPGIIWRILVFIVLHATAILLGCHFGWPWGVACAALVAAVICWAILNPGCQWLGPVYRTIGGGEILITIDDGPDPHDTPILLDLLDKHGTRAIFFMIGEKVRAHPALAREVIRRGHEIGNHTLTHPQASFWCAGPWRTRHEIGACQQIIADITGKRPRLFRAPVGHRNLFTHPIASALGLEIMAWNRRGYDAVEKDPRKVLARILPDLGQGDIVLLHEATPIAAEVLAAVLDKAEVEIS